MEEGNLKGLSEEGGETKVKLGEGCTGKGEQKSDSLGKERRTEERKKRKKEKGAPARANCSVSVASAVSAAAAAMRTQC